MWQASHLPCGVDGGEARLVAGRLGGRGVLVIYRRALDAHQVLHRLAHASDDHMRMMMMVVVVRIMMMVMMMMMMMMMMVSRLGRGGVLVIHRRALDAHQVSHRLDDTVPDRSTGGHTRQDKPGGMTPGWWGAVWPHMTQVLK
jgi:hypothetical protein